VAFAARQVHLTGALMSWIFVGGGIGGMVVPWLVGQLFERISPRVTMPALLTNTLIELGLLVAMLLLVRRKETVQ
jgi:predicted MFS family arabinose efflux permease